MKLVTPPGDAALSNPNQAARYLSQCAAEGREALLVGLRTVAQSSGGIHHLSETTDLNRESLYKMLSEGGNPRLSSILSVLDALGFELQVRRRGSA